MDTVLEATDLTKHDEDFSLRSVSLEVRRRSSAVITAMALLIYRALMRAGVRVKAASEAHLW